MKRFFDLVICIITLILVIIPILFISLLVKTTSDGPVIYWSKRIGVDGKSFMMPKFRSMIVNTPTVATNLLKNPEQYSTPIGNFLRKYSLDEIPQLWSIIIGDMSVVGPRPALYTQLELIRERKKLGIDKILPGLTGLAQINGRDELSIQNKIKYDYIYLKNQTIFFDVNIILKTITKTLKKEGITH